MLRSIQLYIKSIYKPDSCKQMHSAISQQINHKMSKSQTTTKNREEIYEVWLLNIALEKQIAVSQNQYFPRTGEITCYGETYRDCNVAKRTFPKDWIDLMTCYRARENAVPLASVNKSVYNC